MMKKYPLAMILFLMGSLLFSAPDSEPSAEAFIRVLRLPSGETWGKLDGSVFHRRRGQDPVEAPISFRTLFTSKATIGQLVFRETEISQLTQSRVPPYSSSVENNGKSTLSDVGLKPSDLVMNFIDWDFLQELPQETIRMQECRIFLFESPESKERVKVYASSKYAFPVRVEWIEKDTGKPFRTLDVNGLKKIGDLWVVEELAVSGPGWKSIVRFQDMNAGYVKQGIPEDLFVE